MAIHVSPSQVLSQLKEKTKNVHWNQDQRKEKYALFAKSFKDKKANEENVLLFDLEDIKNLLHD
jgi:uncharacterized protein